MFSRSLFDAYSISICRRASSFCLGRQLVVVVDPMHLLRDVRQHERLVIVRRHELDALVREVHRVPLLVEHEEQIVLDVAIRLLGRRQLAIGDVIELHLLHELLDARLLQHLHQALVLRAAELRLVQAQRRRVRVVLAPDRVSASPTSALTSSRLTRAPAARRRRCARRTSPSFSFPTGPEMMSGVRASSISTESTSSTIA